MCDPTVPLLLGAGVVLCVGIKVFILIALYGRTIDNWGKEFVDLVTEMLPETVLGCLYAVYTKYEAALKWDGRQDFKRVSLSVNIFHPKLPVAGADSARQDQQFSMLVRTVSESTMDLVRSATVDPMFSFAFLVAERYSCHRCCPIHLRSL